MFECSKETGTNLNGFVEVDDDLGGVAGEEHDHNCGEQGSHCAVTPELRMFYWWVLFFSLLGFIVEWVSIFHLWADEMELWMMVLAEMDR